jgi:hypothetical protein
MRQSSTVSLGGPRLRFLVVSVVMVAVLAAAGAAYASAPTDGGPWPLSTLPDCLTAVPDTSGPHICKVRPAPASGITHWQAGTGEWIVVRVGDLEPDQASCLAVQASVVATVTIDDATVPADLFPCQLSGGFWIVDYRALFHPLAPGDHAVSESWHFTTAASDVPAGSTITFSTTLTVTPRG